ncbi:MAG: PAS domain S-box protein [Spartobacteria bacterium]
MATPPDDNLQTTGSAAESSAAATSFDRPTDDSRDGKGTSVKPADKPIERSGEEPTSVVGIGASAGGLRAIQQLLGDLPGDSGLSFVVVMHLSPEHESNLAPILQRCTPMPVVQVTEEVAVRPNRVYVIPPNRHLAMNDGKLVLREPQQSPGRRVAIDLFFRTLAEHWGQRAVSITLSGSDGDGVIGVKHIKAQGGVTIAQEPGEAEHDSMPRSAIATGMIDWVLPVSAMPAKLIEYVRNEERMKLPPEDGPVDEEGGTEDTPGSPTVAQKTEEAKDETALQEALSYLRDQTGHDFTHYKRATILRRIARRMQVNSLDTVPRYLDYLRTQSEEPSALLRDLLIGVTHFFRDPSAFAALEANVPQLFAGKNGADQVRVWAPGCSTGEEAYTIAMLLCEHAAKLDHPPSIQIFATDIDEEAIADAREGIYPLTIEADVSQERLRRFFSHHHGGYRVKKEIREMILFAPHDLLRDPPFSRLDLVICRNLLIYLKPDAQHRVLDIFHFALRPGGLLFLGGSEHVDESHTLFAPIDKKQRIHVRRTVPRAAGVLVSLPHSNAPRRPMPQTILPRQIAPLVFSKSNQPSLAAGMADPEESRARSLSELHLALVERYAPPSIIVDQSNRILHSSEHAGQFLQFSGGEPTKNLLKLVHPALRIELRTALFRSAQTNENVTVSGVPIELNGQSRVINLHVRPAHDAGSNNTYFLIVFEEKPASEAPDEPQPLYEEPAPHLEQELEHMRAQLNATVEQYEASTEELKASNEELQAMNEELRSATEELETGREELQSVNEELITVNQELKTSVEDLARSNSDLQNLIASTDIGTIFLNRELRIKRFTPRVQELFNIIASDIGRPLSDLTRKIDYTKLPEDAEQVLRDLVPIECEVQHETGQYFLVRIVPYRTAEDRIDGVVINFVDITKRRKAEEQVRKSEQRFRRGFEIETVGIRYFTVEGEITGANDAFLRMTGYSRLDLENGRLRWDTMTPEEFIPESKRAIAEFLENGVTTPYEKQYIRKDGSRFWALFAATRLDEKEGIEFVIDISRQKGGEEALRASEERFRQFGENSADVLWITDAKTRELEYLSPAFETIWGESRDAIMRDGRRWNELLHPDDRPRLEGTLERLLAGESTTIAYRVVRPNDGEVRWIRDTGFPIRNESGQITRVAGVAQDVTGERAQMQELHATQERLHLLIEGARDYAMFLIGLDNRIIYWSAGAERIFGWTAEEAVGRYGGLIFTPEDAAIQREETELEVASRDGFANDQRWHMRKDGTRVWIDGIMRRLDDENGNLRGFAKVARDATEQRKVDEELRESRKELERRVRERTAELTAEITRRAQLEQEILLISEREKRRIGQDLHDSLCQELAAAAFFLESTAHANPEQAEVLSEAARIVNANVGLARDLARGLYPVELTSSGLANSLRELAYLCNQRSIRCTFECPSPVRVRDAGVALNLYRIAQEAITNATKNGKAKNIVISLSREHGKLMLTIKDDGRGFSGDETSKGMGIHIMKYRADVLGGTLEIESKAGRGTCVTCTIPRQHPAPAKP